LEPVAERTIEKPVEKATIEVPKAEVKKNKKQKTEATQTEALTTMVVEVPPTFQGGDMVTFRNWVSSQIVYPEGAGEGKVTVKFTVGTDGSVGQIETISSPDDLLAGEMVRILKTAPQWTPGTIDGEPTVTTFVLPIDFMLHNAEPEMVIVHRIEKVEGDPLYIVDGKRVKNLDDIDPNTIEKIEVLKGESAIEKYGNKGKNGVIVVTLKYETVDTGYGQRVKKNKNTSSVSSVDMRDSYAYSDLKSYMRGRVAGVSFIGDKLVIRGVNSINSDIDALILVDGVPVGSFADANAMINPSDVASISVLKDAGATSIYGVRGSNGVVLIATKRGNNE
jgi:TonB-dependent SusC/RagA subfamily outer membrane receptor